MWYILYIIYALYMCVCMHLTVYILFVINIYFFLTLKQCGRWTAFWNNQIKMHVFFFFKFLALHLQRTVIWVHCCIQSLRTEHLFSLQYLTWLVYRWLWCNMPTWSARYADCKIPGQRFFLKKKKKKHILTGRRFWGHWRVAGRKLWTLHFLSFSQGSNCLSGKG